MQRKPSHFGSYCQAAPSGTVSTETASIGARGCCNSRTMTRLNAWPAIGFGLCSTRTGSLDCTQPRGTPMNTERPASMVDPKLLEILVCPVTKGTLEYDATRQELISRGAKLAYPIRDGIPIMLPEEARRID